MARKDEDAKVVTLKSKEDVDKLFNSVQPQIVSIYSHLSILYSFV